jgi:hypothetical protein
MHRCVCIWRYILQITTTNYVSKTSLYTTFRMYPSGPWPWKSWCLHCLWPVRLQHTADHGKRPEIGAGHAFPRHWHMRREGGGYLFLPGFSSLYDAIHGWMMGRMDGRVTWWHPWMDDGTDGWMAKASWSRRPLLYVIVSQGKRRIYIWKLKYFTMQKCNLQNIAWKRNQNP